MRVSATLLALALAVTACSGGNEDSGSQGGGDAGDEAVSGGTFSYTITNPENPLVPGNTSESEGAQIMDALFTGLVTYDVETSESSWTAWPSPSSPRTTPCGP